MALGPMEIHHKEFNTVRMGGYNKEEVDSFLDQVADEMDRLLHRSQELVGMVEGMRAKVVEFDGMQQTLQNALINAQRSADSLIQDAQTKAEELLQQANEEAANRAEEVNRHRDEVMQQSDAEQNRVAANIALLRTTASEYISMVRELLDATSRKVSEYESIIVKSEVTAPGTAIYEEPLPLEQLVDTVTPPEYEAPLAPAFETPIYEPSAAPIPEYPAASAVEAPLYETPTSVETPIYEPPTTPAEAPLYEPPTSVEALLYNPPAAPIAEAPLYEPPAAPIVEEYLYTPPVIEPSYQEPEPLTQEAGMMEPHAYVPDIKPMEEMPEEDSPIPRVEMLLPEEVGPIEPQAFVPSIHLEGEGTGLPASMTQKPAAPSIEDITRLTLEDLAGTAGPDQAPPAAQPPTPDDVDKQFAPSPEKDEKGEKHFFWE